MMKCQRAGCRLAILVLCGLLAGCGRGKINLVPVQGTILHLGKPVAEATVCFIPDGPDAGGRVMAQGTTRDDGTFELESYPHGAGVMPGKYKVTVFHFSWSRDIPRRYTKFPLTPLTAEVKAGESNNPVYDLQGVNYDD